MKKNNSCKMTLVLGIPIMLVCVGQLNCALAFDFAWSPNPVGSGARAIGMGGAFIAVADDATAASWNPGGLVQLKTPEMSVVGNWFHKTEDNDFRNHPESCGSQSVSGEDLNYLSIAYPFNLFDRNMVLSLNYQKLYDFAREWDFQFITNEPLPFPGVTETVDAKHDYEQSGGLSAIGIAYCIRIIPQLSLGLTLNIWDNNLTPNKWEESSYVTGISTIVGMGIPVTGPYNYGMKDEYSFSGLNANIGILWRPTDRLTTGFVFKTPFTADIKHEQSDLTTDLKQGGKDEKLDMPMSFGIGFSYRICDEFRVSADLYRTEWQDYVYTDSNGKKESPIVRDKSVNEADIDPTHQIRFGMEYLLVDSESHYVIPFRGGLFYDPVPAQGSPDDYYGLSLGSGFSMGRWVFDIAYQYRFGNDVGASLITGEPNFSQDVEEHMVYSSLIIHF